MGETEDSPLPSSQGSNGGTTRQPRPDGVRPLQEHASGDGAPLDPASEETLWVGRSHWAHFAGSLALGALVVVLAAVVCLRLRSSMDGLFRIWLTITAASAGIVAGRILWRILYCRYRLTNQRLFIEHGILSQTIDQTELIRVDDVRVRKNLLGRIIGLGSVEILSTDVSDRTMVIKGVRNPEVIAEHIRTHMRTLRRKSLFIENL